MVSIKQPCNNYLAIYILISIGTYTAINLQKFIQTLKLHIETGF